MTGSGRCSTYFWLCQEPSATSSCNSLPPVILGACCDLTFGYTMPSTVHVERSLLVGSSSLLPCMVLRQAPKHILCSGKEEARRCQKTIGCQKNAICFGSFWIMTGPKKLQPPLWYVGATQRRQRNFHGLGIH